MYIKTCIHTCFPDNIKLLYSSVCVHVSKWRFCVVNSICTKCASIKKSLLVPDTDRCVQYTRHWILVIGGKKATLNN